MSSNKSASRSIAWWTRTGSKKPTRAIAEARQRNRPDLVVALAKYGALLDPLEAFGSGRYARYYTIVLEFVPNDLDALAAMARYYGELGDEGKQLQYLIPCRDAARKLAGAQASGPSAIEYAVYLEASSASCGS